MMRIDIMDKGSILNYQKVTRISIQNENGCNTIVITYIDKNGDEQHDVSSIPEYMAINEEIKEDQILRDARAWLEQIEKGE